MTIWNVMAPVPGGRVAGSMAVGLLPVGLIPVGSLPVEPLAVGPMAVGPVVLPVSCAPPPEPEQAWKRPANTMHRAKSHNE